MRRIASRWTPLWARRAFRRAQRRLYRLARRRYVLLAIWLDDLRLLAGLTPVESFSRKLQRKMLRDRRPLLTTFADKLAARAYVEATLGPEFLTDLHLVTASPTALEPAALPREFVVKASHGSGGVVVVADVALAGSELPRHPDGWLSALVRPERIDWDVLRMHGGEWLRLRYGGRREWAYRDVPPRLLCEELLLEGGQLASDFRVFVFNGMARLIQVDTARFIHDRQAFYTPEWERLDVHTHKAPEGDVPEPIALATMLEAAEALGAETDFVRVDLYAIGERVVVGELTNYPWGGVQKFRPVEFDATVGAWWTAPSRYAQAEIDAARRPQGVRNGQ